jgi:hypothetical protein
MATAARLLRIKPKVRNFAKECRLECNGYMNSDNWSFRDFLYALNWLMYEVNEWFYANFSSYVTCWKMLMEFCGLAAFLFRLPFPLKPVLVVSDNFCILTLHVSIRIPFRNVLSWMLNA